MAYTRSEINLAEGRVSYLRWGRGPRAIIALHGYGERALSFEHWGEALPEAYSLYAPDLPLHGSGRWQEDQPFTVEHLRALIKGMAGDGTFILCGYSMGGRLSLSYTETYPEDLERLVLFAPDGLKVNFWYWLATQTRTGNRFFRYTMEHPAWFLGIVRGLGALRLVNRGVVKYVHRHLGTPAARMDLYRIWTCMRTFRPDLEAVQQQIKGNGLHVRLVFGRFDRIIQPSQGYRFEKELDGSQCKLIEVSAGHQLLTHALTPLCLSILTD